jgi:hypothetical protein
MQKLTLVIGAVLLLSSCVNLQGIPLTLTAAQKADLASGDRVKALALVQSLSDSYEEARNDNLRFAYWSNVPFLALAAAAAGAVYYKAHRDVLAGIGIAAGTLVGFNTLTNARANAKVYQSGINALSCVQTKLGGYTSVGTLGLRIQALDGAVDTARRSVAASKRLLDGADETANKERAANPRIGAAQMAAHTALEQAINDAIASRDAAEKEMHKFSTIAEAIRDKVRQIHIAVSAKITSADLNMEGLIKGMETPKVPVGGAKPAAAPLQPKAGSSSPIADITETMQSQLQEVQRLTTELKSAVAEFGLTTRLQEVDVCIKGV